MNRAKVTSYLLLITILLIGAFLRFYKLDWGSGYFFHPDEYHIASAVERISFPGQMNPHLFSYGSFTVYLIYFTKITLVSIISHFSLLTSHLPAVKQGFPLAIYIGRFYSALFSTLTIALVYFISRKLVAGRPAKRDWSLVAATLCALLPGSIQQAHFTTPESILTFWLMLALLMSLNYLTKKESKYLYLAAASQGLALGTKIVALTFLPVVFLLPFFLYFPAKRDLALRDNQLKKPAWTRVKPSSLVQLIKQIIFAILITIFFFFLTFPYGILDWRGWRGSLNYEGEVATGKLMVFYTRQFIDTTPILFQFQKIFPYALGPAVLILGVLGFLSILSRLSILRIRKRKYQIPHTTYYILLLAFLSYFLPNAFLFAKWTRFMALTFPFFALFTGYFLSSIKNKKLSLITYFLSLITTLVWTAMFFSIYLRPDVRLSTTEWINHNLNPNSIILVESGNMLDIPLYNNTNIKRFSFDFYNLEGETEQKENLIEYMLKSDYFVIQSRRVFTNHQRARKQFPFTARFYDLLFFNQLGFEKVKEFSSHPQFSIFNFRIFNEAPISQFSINDELAEETWSVFDHPVIRVYKKTRFLTQQDYEKILKI